MCARNSIDVSGERPRPGTHAAACRPRHGVSRVTCSQEAHRGKIPPLVRHDSDDAGSYMMEHDRALQAE
jgi:hypothetical protein